ncbi:MAG: RNA 2',3'-cyclic phosphodiesterase [Candidatus Neomarinimicrobiota bacterium]
MQDKLIKTFISSDTGVEVKKLINDIKAKILLKSNAIKWVNRENIHLTLRFIGPTVIDEISKLNSMLENVSKNFKDFSLEINGTGCFPKEERPRIIWLGIKGEVAKLNDLVLSINKNLEEMGYPNDDRNFVPHITLGRIKYPQKNIPDLKSFLNYSFKPIEIKVKKFSLFQTETFSSGSIYSLIGTHHLSND